jgi:hypothetical protein
MGRWRLLAWHHLSSKQASTPLSPPRVAQNLTITAFDFGKSSTICLGSPHGRSPGVVESDGCYQLYQNRSHKASPYCPLRLTRVGETRSLFASVPNASVAIGLPCRYRLIIPPPQNRRNSTRFDLSPIKPHLKQTGSGGKSSRVNYPHENALQQIHGNRVIQR